MNNFRGIRYAQSKLMDILTTKGYREGTLAASTQATLDDLIAFCAAYEKHRTVQELRRMNDCDFTHYHNQRETSA